jgi:sortase (surface protein transpeptidase)
VTLDRARTHARFAGLVVGTAGLLFVVAGSDHPPASTALGDPPTTTPTGTPTTPSPTATRTATPALTPTPEPTATPTPQPASSSGRSAPRANVTRMTIPRFGVSAAIEYIGLLPSNQLDVPKNPHNVGWYYIYAAPGAGRNAVFSAHVDYYPNIRGPFYNLKSLVPGDLVTVTVEGVELQYEVFRYTRYDVYSIPMGDLIVAADRPAGEEWITLITCGGRFQPHNGTSGPGEYLDRDVVVARRIN